MPELIHIVLVKLKPSVRSDESAFSTFVTKCNELGTYPSLQPLLTEFKWAEPVYADRTKGFNWALYSRFRHREDYEKYRDDEGHRTFVKEVMSPALDEIMAYDLEV
ncbi:Stress responsive alpha-beta barrel [Ceraceosorus bombacis]|uniref:Stress responsive alpha-beta barrel n=1 Tax=Ceraceosorus bombacis TaxID=401625 RepID=A0A0P1BHG8_9BASI|nr:Stress responsive alpha-beta barrel [Ceraceosorus bombacis]